MLWPNRHRRFIDRLSAYIDGQLSAADTEALEGHLAGCPACRCQLDELRATVLALRQLPQEDLPRSFALTPEQAARPLPRRPAPTAPALSLGLRLAGAALAFALAAVLFVDLGDLGGGGQPSIREGPAPMAFGTPEPEEQFERAAAGPATEQAPGPTPAAPAPGADEGYQPEQAPLPEGGAAPLAPQPTPPPAEPAAQQPVQAAQPGGAIDPLRAAEIALAAALALLLASSLTLAFARRKR